MSREYFKTATGHEFVVISRFGEVIGFATHDKDQFYTPFAPLTKRSRDDQLDKVESSLQLRAMEREADKR